MVKRILSAFLAIILVIALSSCDDEAPLLSHCELRMPIGDGYSSVETDNYDLLYTNGRYMIALTRISFVAGMMGEGIPETLSEVEFAEFYLEKCSREAAVIEDEVTYVEYYDESADGELYYLEAFYRSPYAYFVILFVSSASLDAESGPVFLELAKNVYFTT